MIIECCRVCGNRHLLSILDLGPQVVTSVFPASREHDVPVVPLELVKCSPDGCGLVQLRHTADFDVMYGEHYGYRSAAGNLMIRHLGRKVADIMRRIPLDRGDIVVDIGSNDGTLLRAYPDAGLTLVGFDPSGEKFREHYPPNAELVVDFFAKDLFTRRYHDRKAKVITSIAMFYDLPRPMEFMRQVHDILDDDGIWVLEHSYLPAMLENTAYDVICHEHLEYYALRNIEWMAQRVGLTVISAETNSVYGGSLCTTLAKRPERHRVDHAGLARIRARERELELDTMAPYEKFARQVPEARDRLLQFLDDSRRAGKLTLGYGASTKGNVILQYCGLSEAELPCIGELNEEKWGCFTPGTGIPIVSQSDAKSRKPDQLLVLPWIHRKDFVGREQEFVAGGGRLVFPLPGFEIVSSV